MVQKVPLFLLLLFGYLQLIASAQSPLSRVVAMRSGQTTYLYEKQEYSVDQLLKKEPLLSELRDQYFALSDPNDFLSPAEQRELSTNSVEFMNFCKNGPVVIDAVGFAITKPEFEGKEKPWKNLIETFRQEHVGKPLTNEIVKDLVQLKRSSTQLWIKGKKQNLDEQIYVKARIGERQSKIRKKREHWLAIDIGVTGTNFDEFFQNELYETISQNVFTGTPLEKIPQPIMPHPESEETLFEMHAPRKLKPNRGNGAEVKVSDDGLKPRERELDYNFSFTIPAGKKEFQIEGHAMEGAGRIDSELHELMTLIEKRIPTSSVETAESLHLKVGNACAAFRKTYSYINNHFAITLLQQGDYYEIHTVVE